LKQQRQVQLRHQTQPVKQLIWQQTKTQLQHQKARIPQLQIQFHLNKSNIWYPLPPVLCLFRRQHQLQPTLCPPKIWNLHKQLQQGPQQASFYQPKV
ncbi:hypothetical protein P5Z58_04220, partial [Limosilactobacillus mucosae]|nr:hypothetical protein [Limosilactobacillus mucosae]